MGRFGCFSLISGLLFGVIAIMGSIAYNQIMVNAGADIWVDGPSQANAWAMTWLIRLTAPLALIGSVIGVAALVASIGGRSGTTLTVAPPEMRASPQPERDVAQGSPRDTHDSMATDDVAQAFIDKYCLGVWAFVFGGLLIPVVFILVLSGC